MSNEDSSVEKKPNLSRTTKVLALSIGSSLVMLANIVSGMVAARYLTKSDYATIRQTFLAYEFAAPFLSMGLPNALYYYLPRNKNDQRGILIDNIALLLLSGCIFSLFILFGGHNLLAERFNNQNLKETLPWLVVYPLFIMPVAGLAAVMVFAERVRTLAIYNTLSSLVIACTGVAAIFLTRSYDVPILLRIWVPGLCLPFAIYLMFQSAPGNFRIPNGTSMIGMLRYSIPLGLATMFGTLTIQLHAVIVASMCSPDDFAVYINGAIEIPIIGIVTGSITTIVFSEMSAACAKGDKRLALEIFRAASIKSACILFPTMCYFMAVAENFMVFLYSEEYRASAIPFVLYLFVLPIRIVVYGSALMSLGMSRDILVRSVFDFIINSIVCYVLVSMYGYVGAAASLPITLYFWSTPFNLVRIGHGFSVKWYDVLPWKDILRVAIFCILMSPVLIAIVKFLPDLIPVASLVLAGAIYFPIVLYIFYRIGYIGIPIRLERFLPNFMIR